MKNERDEDLDKLFKKGMEDPVNEPIYRESDWDAMEQLLGQRKKRAGIVYWLPMLGSAAALLLLFLGLWIYKPWVAKSNKNQQMAAQHQKENTGKGGGATRHTAADSTHTIQNPANYASTPVHHGAGKNANRSFPYPPVGSAATKPGRHKENGSAIESYASNGKNAKKSVNPASKINDLGTTGNNTLAKAPGHKDIGTADGQKTVDANTLANAPGRKDVGTADGQKTVDANALANAPGHKDVSTADAQRAADANSLASARGRKDVGTADDKKAADANTLAVSKPAVKVKVPGRMGAAPATLAVTAIASSDLNGITPLQGGRVGGNLGAMFSVGIKKWTFSTGAMYSIKPYQESYEQYHTSYVFKTPPSSVTANCRMIDIPLNVNYQVYNKFGNKFTVGSGLSSYIILRENYTFNYSNPYTYGPSSFSVANRNRNILGILNLDATYEHRIDSRFGIAIQPYYKIPLSNVGVSQVKLESAGVAVGVSWNLNSFKKPN
jgi:hypothetical protein